MSESGLGVRSDPGVAIAALASAVPEYCIDQRATRDIVLSIAPELRSHEALFLNTGIKTRYSCVPLEWHFESHGWAARNRVFQDAAVDLLERVSRECIDLSGIDLDEIEAIVTVSTTGSPSQVSTQSWPIAWVFISSHSPAVGGATRPERAENDHETAKAAPTAAYTHPGSHRGSAKRRSLPRRSLPLAGSQCSLVSGAGYLRNPG